MLKDDKCLSMLEEFLKERQYQKGALLEILHKAHELYGYFDKRLLTFISEHLNFPPSHVYGVASFYNFFKLKKVGEHVVTACMGTACYVMGVEEIITAIEREFKLERGESTSDGKFSLFVTRCIGACATAPNIVVDEEVMGKATKETVLRKIRFLLGGEAAETS